MRTTTTLLFIALFALSAAQNCNCGGDSPCCSQYGWCGNTAEYCDRNQGCQSGCWGDSSSGSSGGSSGGGSSGGGGGGGGGCGNNCPAGNCGSNCPCGAQPNNQDINSWCSQWSGVDQRCCQCIANAESSGNANAMHGNGDGSLDVGLFQINSVNWASCNNGNAPCDVQANFNCAKQIYQWAGNWSPWATCGGCGCC